MVDRAKIQELREAAGKLPLKEFVNPLFVSKALGLAIDDDEGRQMRLLYSRLALDIPASDFNSLTVEEFIKSKTIREFRKIPGIGDACTKIFTRLLQRFFLEMSGMKPAVDSKALSAEADRALGLLEGI